jgi:putative heme iron utilization protein
MHARDIWRACRRPRAIRAPTTFTSTASSSSTSRYIGGFGRIFWLEPQELRLDPESDPLAAGARGIIDHMNEDHADALKLYCSAFKSVRPARAVMVGVDQWGFDVECTSPDVRLRFDFDAPATMESIRPIVVDLVKRARALLASSPAA